ncbi:nitrate reductase molybdenum cofactor assembly chaperone [Phycicoccus sp. M110.8]|uniref:nitrate reductase molybdenum cofactor assembly chaperone n=1 Tax=Phycicoccus sp. M110.8 TaxID=3075433 RepID=UPI0028FD3829|nr:nitrate reductase molybdenum cofactor assembly chaperone [Phycicoccus sp. M110.8]MDU0315435.1 nitrate reductase molybdenum cofactor assembly chaperone [Phycicoccus sp. M110.8]
MLGRSRRTRAAAGRLDDRTLATAWQVVSLLLDYPTEELVSRRPLLESAVAQLPASVAEPLRRFLADVGACPLGQLQRDYVETFDVTRRCSLYLTYFAHGDTRKRGLALVQFKQAYRRAGAELDTDELPDHLGVVLEFGATTDLDVAWRLLLDHRAGLEVLRIALADKGSPWHDVVLALVATLPELQGDDEEQLAALVAAGPPSEDVGLDTQPYALDPRLNPRPTEPTELGPTIPVGAP